MELSERKKQILHALIETYIQTAEPVGSKAILENYQMPFSSATIRNEMAELTELGYLEQPHTSAGRVPTDLGYRTYVTSLMGRYSLSKREKSRIDEGLSMRITELEQALANANRIISELTAYTSLALTPHFNTNYIKRLEMLYVDRHTFLLVVMTSNGLIKNRVCRLNVEIDPDTLGRIAAILQRRLTGVPLDLITLRRISRLEDELMEFRFFLQPILRFVEQTLSEIDQTEVFTEGVGNILDFPEYRDVSRAKEFFNFLGDKQEIKNMLAPTADTGIRIIIGDENPVLSVLQSSLIIGNYRVGEKVVGAIGIIGPTRMDYSKVVGKLDYFTKTLSKLLSETFYDDE